MESSVDDSEAEAMPTEDTADMPEGSSVLQQIDDGILAGVDPDHRAPLEKVVVGGQRLLYDQETHQKLMDNMRDIGEDSDPRNVAIAVGGIMTILKEDAQGGFPDDVLVPAGSMMVIEVIRFLEEAGMLEPTPEFIGNAIEEYLALIMQKVEFDQPQEEAPPDEMGGVSPSARQAPMQQGGIIGGVMQ